METGSNHDTKKTPEELSISGISEMLNAHSEYSLEYSTGELIFQGPGFAHKFANRIISVFTNYFIQYTQDGPLPVINGVITPINGLIIRKLGWFHPSYRSDFTQVISGSGGPPKAATGRKISAQKLPGRVGDIGVVQSIMCTYICVTYIYTHTKCDCWDSYDFLQDF